ncbi:replicative DNA helicase [Suttonella ornithocola]|uniref:Replicative DNA helicase n=1 Tax=Suttonella ornithocola TaxID=279832 RepID=A0A380MQG4_9GAMM|nr:replicative DNA helicase [Suttonella ornithocola]SUO94414.1 Replicative DNA helicase [Suttonella ornithocola]
MSDYDAVSRVKEPPKSSEAEQAVIGALLLDNEAWNHVSELVSAEDFFYQNNRIIFQTLAEQAELGEPFDILTITNRLREKNQLDKIGDPNYLRALAMETPTVTNAIAYARIIREQSIKRRLISAAGDIANSAYFPEGRDARTILDDAERKVFAIAETYQNNTREGLIPVQNVAAETLQYIRELSERDSDITGISTGLKDLDKMTAGLQRGDLIIVAGRPSMGKTAFSLNLAQNVALGTKLPVAIFSLEMPARSLVMRMISSLGQVHQEKLRRGQLDASEVPNMNLAVTQLKTAPIFIDDTSTLSVTDLRARVRRLKRERGDLGLVLIDYLQLMQMPEGDNRATQIGDLSRALKLLAKEVNTPVIALSQLNRGLENRTDKRPIMSDIRESGAIEQDADIIMFVYRDEVYNKESPDRGKAEIIIGKQRNGPIGTVYLAFRGEYTLFDNLAYGEPPEDY